MCSVLRLFPQSQHVYVSGFRDQWFWVQHSETSHNNGARPSPETTGAVQCFQVMKKGCKMFRTGETFIISILTGSHSASYDDLLCTPNLALACTTKVPLQSRRSALLPAKHSFSFHKSFNIILCAHFCYLHHQMKESEVGAVWEVGGRNTCTVFW